MSATRAIWTVTGLLGCYALYLAAPDFAEGLFYLVLILGAYFFPTITAERRHHPNVNSIAVINTFLGWTFIGWVVALAMAVSAKPVTAA